MNREQNARKFIARQPTNRKRNSTDRVKANTYQRRRGSKGKDAKAGGASTYSSRGRSRGGNSRHKMDKVTKVMQKGNRRKSQGFEKGERGKQGYISNYMKMNENIRKSSRSTRRKSNKREKSRKKKGEKPSTKSRNGSKTPQGKKAKAKRSGKSTPKMKKAKVQAKSKKDNSVKTRASLETHRQNKMRPSIININGLSRISEKTQERNTNLDSREGLFLPGSQVHGMNLFTPPREPGEGINFLKRQQQQRSKGVTASTNRFNFPRDVRKVLGTSLMLRKSLKKFGKTWSSKPKNDLLDPSGAGQAKTINLDKLQIRKNPNYDKTKGTNALKKFVKMYKDIFEKEKKNKVEKFSSAFRNREQNFSMKKQEAQKTESMFQPKPSRNKLRSSGRGDLKSISSISKKNKMIPQTTKKKNVINKIEEVADEDEGLGVSQTDPKSSRKIFNIKKDEPVKIGRPSTPSKVRLSSQGGPVKLTKDPVAPQKITQIAANPQVEGRPDQATEKRASQNSFGRVIESVTVSNMGNMAGTDERASMNLTGQTGITSGVSVLKKEISKDLKDAIDGKWKGNTGQTDKNSDLWYTENMRGNQDLERLMQENNLKVQNLEFSGKTFDPQNELVTKANNLNISSENIKDLVDNIPDSSKREIETKQTEMDLGQVLSGKPASFQKTIRLEKTGNFDQTLGGLLSQGNRTASVTQDLNELLSNMGSKPRYKQSIGDSGNTEMNRERVNQKIISQNLNVDLANVIPEVQSGQNTRGTTLSNLPSSKESLQVKGLSKKASINEMANNNEVMEMDDDFCLPANRPEELVESNIPRLTVNNTSMDKKQDKNYQMSHLLDKTDTFQHSTNLITYNLGPMGSFEAMKSRNQKGIQNQKPLKGNESMNIDNMLDELTEGGHSGSMKRAKSIIEKKQENEMHGMYDKIESEINADAKDHDSKIERTNLQNLAKENAMEMKNLGLTSMNLTKLGHFTSEKSPEDFEGVDRQSSGVMVDEDDNRVNMTMNMTLNMTQLSGLQGFGMASRVTPNESGLDLVKNRLGFENSMVSNYRWNDSSVGQPKITSRFQSNANESFNMLLKGPDLNTELSGVGEGDLVVKMSENQSFQFLKKEDYMNNRFGTNNQSNNHDEYSILKDPLDDDKPKDMSESHRARVGDEYGTNQSNYAATKVKFESGNIYHSNYADSQFKPKGDEPENMVCGPELADMDIEYPEINQKGYNLTDSSINMGKTFQSNQDFSVIEDSRVIGGKLIGKFGTNSSYNLGNKELSALGLLSQTSSLNDQQKTIINKLKHFQPNQGRVCSANSRLDGHCHDC